MKMLRAFAAGLLSAAMAFATIADAQVTTENVGTFTGQALTYRATVIALTPAAATTDLFVITGSATKQIRVRRLHCDGIATAAGTTLLQIVKRSTADTAGTSTAPTAVALNSTNPAAGATIAAYTANPTLGTTVGAIATEEFTSGTTSAASFPADFDFSNQNVVLNGATQALAVNANGATFGAGTALTCYAEWSEQ